jgi:hypothetical protein
LLRHYSPELNSGTNDIGRVREKRSPRPRERAVDERVRRSGFAVLHARDFVHQMPSLGEEQQIEP